MPAVAPVSTPPVTAVVPKTPTLPPIPDVDGPLLIHVQYPDSLQRLTTRDSNFIFGSVGSGRAALTINGVSVDVRANGAFLAFLPVPPDSAPRYELVATRAADTARLVRPVRLPSPRAQFTADGPLIVDSGSIAPRGLLARRDDELVHVSVRTPATAMTYLKLANGDRQTLFAEPQPSDVHDTLAQIGYGVVHSADIPARLLRAKTEIIVERGSFTGRFPLSVVEPVPVSPPQFAELGSKSEDPDRIIIGRPIPGGTYKWFFFPGTIVQVTGQQDEFTRVRLDDALEVWVARREVAARTLGASAPHRQTRDARVVPSPDWVDVEIPISERPAYDVTEGDHSLALTLYDTRSNTDIIRFVANDSLVRDVRWEQVTHDRVRYTLKLSSQPFGYQAMYRGGAFVLRVRRPPVIDGAAPLRGLVIAVDPGHPPIGATGPTGLYEPVPALAIGFRVRELLQAKGATVFMTRTSDGPVDLNSRPVMARKANAHAMVSIHLNALPDGINPFNSNGTGTYYFWPHSETMARALQNALVAQLGLKNIGVHYDNLAVARVTWMPSVLCEGAFLMIPEQENALRTPEFQAAYARGVVEGLEAYFRSLARDK